MNLTIIHIMNNNTFVIRHNFYRYDTNISSFNATSITHTHTKLNYLILACKPASFNGHAKCNGLIVASKKIRKTTLKDIIVVKITNEENMEIIELREKYSEMQWMNRCQ